MVFESILNVMRGRHFRGMEKQTEQLNPQTRKLLRESLIEDLPAETEELQRIQDELDMAHSKLEELERKEEFVATRLNYYKRALARVKAQSAPPNPNNHAQMLQSIEESHLIITRGIELLKERIECMERRQHDLEFKVKECQVVLEAADRVQELEEFDHQKVSGVNDTDGVGTGEFFQVVELPSSNFGKKDDKEKNSSVSFQKEDEQVDEEACIVAETTSETEKQQEESFPQELTRPEPEKVEVDEEAGCINNERTRRDEAAKSDDEKDQEDDEPEARMNEPESAHDETNEQN